MPCFLPLLFVQRRDEPRRCMKSNGEMREMGTFVARARPKRPGPNHES